MVDIKSKKSSVGGLINDIITLTIDDPIWMDRAKNTILLVIHNILWPLQSYEPLKRDDTFCSANYHDKVASQNTRKVLVGKSKISLSTGIHPKRKRNGVCTGHQGIPVLNKNKYRQTVIPHQQSQSRHKYHPPCTVLSN